MDAIKEGDGTLLDSMMFTYGSGLSSGMLHECSTCPPSLPAARAAS